MFDSTMMGRRPRSTRVGLPDCRGRRGRESGGRRRPAVTVTLGWVALGWVTLLVPLGCASHESPEDLAERQGPLPYQVGVYLDTETLPYRLPQIDEDAPRVQYLSRDEEILEMVDDSLAGESPVVSHVVLLKSRAREAALEEAQGLDLLLGVGFDTAHEYTEISYSPGWGALEVATFAFGGFPSWFVPTVEFETPARLTIGVLDLHQPEVRAWYNGRAGKDAPAFDWSDTLKATAQKTTLLDRTLEWTDYLCVLFVPPMIIVPGDIERVSETLTEGVNEQLSTRLAEAVRDRLLSQDWVRRLAVVYLEPDPMLVVEGEDMALKLSLANREGGELRRLEILRLAPRASDWRWQATPDELQELGDRFRALPERKDYVRFEVPQRIPVAAGANLVKVRMVHETGEQILRTMLYVR